MPRRTAHIEGSLAFDVEYVSESAATGTMPITDGLRNPLGKATAGAMIWFADIVATALVLQGNEPSGGMSGFPVAVNINATVVSNTTKGALRARSHFIKQGRRVSTVRTLVESDEGRLLLDLTTTHFVT